MTRTMFVAAIVLSTLAASTTATVAPAPAAANYLPWNRPLHRERSCTSVIKCEKVRSSRRACKKVRVCRPRDRRLY